MSQITRTSFTPGIHSFLPIPFCPDHCIRSSATTACENREYRRNGCGLGNGLTRPWRIQRTIGCARRLLLVFPGICLVHERRTFFNHVIFFVGQPDVLKWRCKPHGDDGTALGRITRSSRFCIKNNRVFVPYVLHLPP